MGEPGEQPRLVAQAAPSLAARVEVGAEHLQRHVGDHPTRRRHPGPVHLAEAATAQAVEDFEAAGPAGRWWLWEQAFRTGWRS